MGLLMLLSAGLTLLAVAANTISSWRYRKARLAIDRLIASYPPRREIYSFAKASQTFEQFDRWMRAQEKLSRS